MAFTNPTVAEFKTFFARSFPFGTDPNTSVLDSDVTTALASGAAMIYSAFPTQAAYTYGFNLLSAHYLVLNLRAASQGMNGQYNFLQSSKGVESVSESFSIPQRILDNPYWAMLCKTHYGAQYLESILPLMSGQVFTVCGGLVHDESECAEQLDTRIFESTES